MKFDTNKTNSRVLDTMVPLREPQTVVELANFLQSGLTAARLGLAPRERSALIVSHTRRGGTAFAAGEGA